MTVTARSLEKAALLQKLEKLLDVAGAQMTWEALSEELRCIPIPALRALVYRVEQARSQANEDGHARGKTSS
jgi:hypothetical protein